ncbi:MAG: carboxypeptidase-like regulatory domain-containing protein [Bacteroidales bacterium]|jgi:hypothetical protein|nr:carboxypeptidase-like regulatory domain-containing protein [Bacteroidales bacterium]
MKKIIYIAIATMLIFSSCKKISPEEGSIVGFVSNELEHELQRAKITLTDNNGKKETTETGSDGRYEFQNLTLGQSYTVVAELSGYHSDTITTKVDKVGVRGDFVLKEIALRVSSTYIDASTNNYTDFIIYNDSQREMAYLIEKNVSWLELSKTSGILQAKSAEPIHIIIDKGSMPLGITETKIIVNSSHEFAEITLNLSRNPTLYTLEITGINATSAILHGLISDAGEPAYTERGFCYSSTNQTPSITDMSIVSMGNGVSGQFSDSIKFLSQDTRYYTRTYAKVGNNIVYGNTEQFQTQLKPSITIADYLAISDGIAVIYSFSENATVFYAWIYSQTTLPDTDNKIIEDLKTREVEAVKTDWLYYINDGMDGIDIEAGNAYFWCAIAEDANGNISSLLKQPIQTPSNIFVPQAIHTKKNLSNGTLSVDIIKTTFCYSYVSMWQQLDDIAEMNLPDILFAWICYRNYEWLQYDNLINYEIQTNIQPNKTYVIYSLGYDNTGENGGKIDKHFFNRTQWNIQPSKSNNVFQKNIQKLPISFMQEKIMGKLIK